MLALLVAAALTMGAVAVPNASRAVLVPPDRAPARAELASLTAAATRTSSGVVSDVRRLAATATALDEVSPRPVEVASWWSRLPPPPHGDPPAGAPPALGGL